eukprot:TRINITY_DN15106_c0_g2_i1.p1 TRINITY_DN15106_c0_g2~~TRINITY_DN15106_c0_g2_i1.p1  ORF type:complete len:575 (+),score=222.12 TRINITY_DN15106_c0_g2_i1:170-1726(+)
MTRDYDDVDSRDEVSSAVHVDEQLEQDAGIATSVINLVNNTVGAGLFSLPWCMKQSTLGTGMILMTLMCLLNGISFILLAWCCELAQTCSYLKMMHKAFGKTGGTIAQLCVLCYGIGSCISFVVLTGDFLVADQTGLFLSWAPDVTLLHSRPFIVAVIAVTVFFPLSTLRNLAPLRYTSFVSLGATLYAGALCVWGLALDSEKVFPSETPEEIVASPLWIDSNHTSHDPDYLRSTVNYFGFPIGVFAALPLVNVAYTSHYNAPRYYAELKNRSIARWETVIGIVLTFVLAVYATAGITGYLTFGEQTKGDILKNFSDDWHPAVVARLALALLVIFTFPMTCHFIRDSIIDLYYRGEYTTDSLPFAPYMGITLAIVVISCVVGASVTKVEDVLAYKGAIFGSGMVYIFPALMYAMLKRRIELGELPDPFYVRIDADAPPEASQMVYPQKQNAQLTESQALIGAADVDGPGATPVLTQIRLVVTDKKYILLTLLVVWGVVTGFLGVIVTALKQAGVLSTD